MRRFRFVDFAAHFLKGFRNHIVAIEKVPELVEQFGRYGCYTTYFFYSDEILTYVGARAAEERGTVAGYEGKVWAPYFILDIDHPDFELARKAALHFVKLWLDEWQVDPHAVQIYFSGSKGFHLMLDSRVFGRIPPSKKIPHVFSAMRHHLTKSLPEALEKAVDLSIKDRVRLLRLPNTRHEKSGLYKVVLNREELSRFTRRQIEALAQAPRPLTATDTTGLVWRLRVGQNREASKFYKHILRQVRRILRKPFRYPFRHPPDIRSVKIPCAGLEKISQSHIEPGYRNNCAIRLASEFRILGLTAEETRSKLQDWNERYQIHLPVAELESVVRSAYQHPYPYRYSCRDEILRHFCPLSDYEECQRHVRRTLSEQHPGDPEKGK